MEKRPILLYGTGNGADKILDELEKRNIRIQGIFASDGFVRNRYFRSFHVSTLEQLLQETNEKPIILVGFGSSRSEVIEHFEKLEKDYEVLFPDVPLYGNELFDQSYYEAHLKELSDAFEMFNDETSKQLFSDMVNYRLSGKMGYLKRTCTFAQMLQEFPTEKIQTALDGGAFVGDTAQEMLDAFPHLRCLYALEPDAHSYKKLQTFALSVRDHVLQPMNVLLAKKSGPYSLISAGSRGTGVGSLTKRSKEVELEGISIDEYLNDSPIDFIKLDVEGAETDALFGGEKTLRNHHPHLMVSLYHRTEDLWKIPAFLSQFASHYRFLLRRVPCYPAWDLLLLAIREDT